MENEEEKDIASIVVAKSHPYHRSDSCSNSHICDNKAMIKFIVFVLFFFLVILLHIPRCLERKYKTKLLGMHACV